MGHIEKPIINQGKVEKLTSILLKKLILIFYFVLFFPFIDSFNFIYILIFNLLNYSKHSSIWRFVISKRFNFYFFSTKNYLFFCECMASNVFRFGDGGGFLAQKFNRITAVEPCTNAS
jgi:hypothetical protein